MSAAGARTGLGVRLALPAFALAGALLVVLGSSPEQAPSAGARRGAAIESVASVEQARLPVAAIAPGAAPTPRAVPRPFDQVVLLRIRQLVRDEQMGRARALARTLFETAPQSPLTHEVERLTGAHPHP